MLNAAAAIAPSKDIVLRLERQFIAQTAEFTMTRAPSLHSENQVCLHSGIFGAALASEKKSAECKPTAPAQGASIAPALKVMTFGSIVQSHAWPAGACVQILLRPARQDAEVLHSSTNWRVQCQ